MLTKDRVMSRAAEMATEAKRLELTRCGKNSDEGQGNEQSSRDGKGSV
jgi:hypothetical protein